MPNYINSANMLLPIPVIGTDPGPDYATNINNCFTLLDYHDHSSGKGIQVTPAGLDINADLPMGGNNLTLARSLRMSAQNSVLVASADLGCLYVSGVDLYYNDVNGNNIRITQSGNVNAGTGSITGLVSPASATWVSGSSTFVWQSDVNTPAYMDCSSILIRNLVANSKALTLQAPATMAADYSVTLPSLPVSQKIVTLDAAGNMTAAYSLDGTTIAVSGNVIGVGALGIGTAQLGNGAVTAAKLAAANYEVSSSCGGYTTTSTSPVQPSNLAVTITCHGRPVDIILQSDASGNPAYLGPVVAGGDAVAGNDIIQIVKILRGATEVARFEIAFNCSITAQGQYQFVPPPGLICQDTPSAADHTYTVYTYCVGASSVRMQYVKLIAREVY